MSVALAIDDLHIAAGTLALVRGVSLAVDYGAALTILGDTGSGKTLVAEAAMGTLPAELSARGRVGIAGRDFAAGPGAAQRALWGRAIALLPQEPWLALDPTMRAAKQVAEVHRIVRGAAVEAAGDAAARDLSALGLAAAGRKYPFQLSGGMAQRVALAAVHAGGAKILIADEPTKGLDADLRDDVVALLRGEVSRGAAVVTITHDIAVARGLGGTVAVMREGRIVEVGDAGAVLTAPTHDYTRRLLAADPAGWPEPPVRAAGPLVLAGRGLAKRLGGRTLFERLEIELRAGETVAVTGPSGCGKTTLGNVLLGLLPADAGRIDRPGGHAPVRFQKIYQDPPAAFAPRATLRTSLDDVCRRHRIAWTTVADLMERLRLAPALLDRRPDQVSGGELQRVALARVLALGPVFLFADEATSRLDPITQQEVLGVVRAAIARDGISVLVVTHDRRLAAKVGSTVISLDENGVAPATQRTAAC